MHIPPSHHHISFVFFCTHITVSPVSSLTCYHRICSFCFPSFSHIAIGYGYLDIEDSLKCIVVFRRTLIVEPCPVRVSLLE
ncbi:hypothetical protein P691DRAFT_174219 [Macrolepiota fuliginosa MF-IS2]|uniref:Secreted protein n=1 Tax=Macrolepiota fuliginosa MF-IS2 TaxID=1400762 RepID=A0A9P5XBH2_9AGAR|nr:hypothetical protein P691DRAFT_174219 [Macrolepiota fuliginosa MF-IS2]